jgi:hypothetical protein
VDSANPDGRLITAKSFKRELNPALPVIIVNVPSGSDDITLSMDVLPDRLISVLIGGHRPS